MDRPIYNSNQLLDEDVVPHGRGGKKGPVAPNIQCDECNERGRGAERENGGSEN